MVFIPDFGWSTLAFSNVIKSHPMYFIFVILKQNNIDENINDLQSTLE